MFTLNLITLIKLWLPLTLAALGVPDLYNPAKAIFRSLTGVLYVVLEWE